MEIFFLYFHTSHIMRTYYTKILKFSDLVFVTSMGSPVFRHHAEKEVKKVVKAINEQEAFANKGTKKFFRMYAEVEKVKR